MAVTARKFSPLHFAAMDVLYLADDSLSTPSPQRGATMAELCAPSKPNDASTAVGELVIDPCEIIQHVMQDGAPREREVPFRFVLNPEVKKHYAKLCHEYGRKVPQPKAVPSIDTPAAATQKGKQPPSPAPVFAP